MRAHPIVGLLALAATHCTDARIGPRSIDAATSHDAADATTPIDSAPVCSDRSIFAAPDGAGSVCDCRSPCALETARDLARARLATASADVVVALRGGAYRRATAFALDASDSGQNGHTLVFRAAAGESPVLDGAIRVTGFALDATSAGVYVATVPAGTRSRQLYVNGRRATRARGPLRPAGYTETATGFALGDAAVAGWPDRGDLELVGSHNWKSYRCPVTSVDGSGLVAAQPCWTYAHAQAGETFDTVDWLENARELLDEPGEFYLDQATARLYYAPRAGEDLGSADVELPVAEELLHIEGTPAAPAHDIAFEGVAFQHATWLAPSSPDGYAPVQAGVCPRGTPAALARTPGNVVLRGTHAVRLSDCRFQHLGAAGVSLELGAQANTIERAWIEDVSSSAVVIGDVTHTDDHHPSDPSLIVRDNRVTGSYVTRAGAEYLDAPGLFVGYTTHTTIANNELFDLPYTGISVGWGWGSADVGGGTYTTPSTSQQNQVVQNVIGYHMRALRDGGAIYVLGAQPGAVMRGNFVEEQANPYGNLYLDNGSRQWTVQGNAVLVHPNMEVPAPGNPDLSYWLYVQVFAPLATQNTVMGNYTNAPALLTPQPIDPSNTITDTTTLGGDLSPIAPILAAAGSPLRSPEIARGKPATASSTFDPPHPASAGNDGNAFDGWSAGAMDPGAWWQVDLGAEYLVDAVEVVSRWELDQPVTRRSYRIVGATDAAMSHPIVLGALDATGLPHRAIFSAVEATPARVRYVRVEKTAAEYFFLGEVRVHGRAP